MSRRLSRFLAVGVMGFVLQLGALALLITLGWPYEPATAVAVALAVFHNFWWHERWTWRDQSARAPGLVGRIAKYHLAIATTSILGNLLTTATGVELLGWDPILANVVAVALTSFPNFLISDRWIFVRLAMASMLVVGALPSMPAGAEVIPETAGAGITQTRDAACRTPLKSDFPRGRPKGK